MIVYKTQDTQRVERYAWSKGLHLTVAIDPSANKFFIIRNKSVDTPSQWTEIGNSVVAAEQYIDYYL